MPSYFRRMSEHLPLRKHRWQSAFLAFWSFVSIEYAITELVPHLFFTELPYYSSNFSVRFIYLPYYYSAKKMVIDRLKVAIHWITVWSLGRLRGCGEWCGRLRLVVLPLGYSCILQNHYKIHSYGNLICEAPCCLTIKTFIEKNQELQASLRTFTDEIIDCTTFVKFRIEYGG